MQKLNFGKIVSEIVSEDARYDAKAYEFIREGLDHTLKNIKRVSSGATNGHVTGSELLEGLRDYTLKEFGPMGKMVLNEWGIHQCADFGNIVFHLVNHGILGKSDNDKLEDFSEIWSFDEVFVKPYLPLPSPINELPIEEAEMKEAPAPRQVKPSKKLSASKESSVEEAE